MDLKAVEPVRQEDIPEGIPAYCTHLFTVEKFKPMDHMINSRVIWWQTVTNKMLHCTKTMLLWVNWT
jgi:hypothetical protein